MKFPEFFLIVSGDIPTQSHTGQVHIYFYANYICLLLPYSDSFPSPFRPIYDWQMYCTSNHFPSFFSIYSFDSLEWKKCTLLTAVKTSLNIRHIQHGRHIIFPDHQYNSDFSLTSWSSPTFSNFPGQGWKWGSKTKTTCQTSVVLLGSAVAEERAVLGVGKIVITMADSRTNGTDADAVDHLTGVTMIPVLVHELLLRYCVCTQLVIQRLVVLQYSTSNMSAHTTTFSLYLTGPFFQRLLQVRLAFQ